MSYETVAMWLFQPSGDSCDTCAAMQGAYGYAVERPHPNCKCTVTQGDAKAELTSSREELVDQYDMLEAVTWVPRGGESTVEQNWSTGTETTTSGELSGQEGGFGISLGHSETGSRSSGGSTSVTFNYSDDVGGASQLVLATYQVKVYQRIDTYRAHFTEGMGADFEFEVIAGTREEQAFAGYRHEAF